MNAAEIISFTSLLIAITSLLYSRFKNKTDKSFLLFSIRKEFTDSDTLRKVFYLIEYGKIETDINVPGEKDIDQFLSYLDNISYLYLSKELSHADIGPYKYYFHRTFNNKAVMEYIFWVDQTWTKDELKIQESPFSNLVELFQRDYSEKIAENPYKKAS